MSTTRATRTGRSSTLAIVAVLLVALLAACSSSSTPKSPLSSAGHPASSAARSDDASLTSLQRWYRTARTPLARINAALVVAQRAANRNEAAALHASCVVLRHRVDQFASVAAAPDRLVQAAMSRGIANFREGADDCVSGNLNPAGVLVIRGQRLVTKAALRANSSI